MRLKSFLLTAVVFMVLVMAGCTASVGNKSGVQYDENGQFVSADWRKVSLPTTDGRNLCLEAPFDLKEEEPIEDSDLLKNQVAYIYNGSRILVVVYRGTLVDPENEIDFNVNTFMDGINKEKHRPEIKKIEHRTINGQEVTYAEVSLVDLDNEPKRADCLGIDLGSEFWTIKYIYSPSDKESVEVAKRSLASIAIK